LRYVHFNVARTAHLHTLKNVESVTRCKFPVAYEIGAERTGGGARRRTCPGPPGDSSLRHNLQPYLLSLLYPESRHQYLISPISKVLRYLKCDINYFYKEKYNYELYK
jgi:hypothetical protein